MKKSDLVVGRTYTNGRGRKRKLIARDYSGKYRSWESQSDQDCVEYIVLDDGTKKNLTHGERRTMTATAFMRITEIKETKETLFDWLIETLTIQQLTLSILTFAPLA